MNGPDTLPLTTGHRLTALAQTDLPALVAGANNPNVYATTGSLPYPYTTAHGEAFLASTAAYEAQHHHRRSWAIRAPGGELLGVIGRKVLHPLEWHADEVGYWLAEPHWGQGIATAALAAYTAHLHAYEGLVRIEAFALAHNVASHRVLEKNGYQREGHLAAEYRKDGVYFTSVLFAHVRYPEGAVLGN
ncbi:MAG: GNAT family protein [Bacteroidia bacterium]|nr:GNAT family protein [Bacteroidia bacterium]